MKTYKNFLLLAILLAISSCAVKFPNQPYPQGVSKIYIFADKGDSWTNKFFLKELQALLKEHKVEIRIGEKSKASFLEATDFQPNEQQKKVQDIRTFKPDIILELTAFNFAVNAQMTDLMNKTGSNVAIVRDTNDLKKAIEKEIEVQDAKKLINHARVSAFLYLPNQYVPVWHTGIIETDPDVKTNMAESALIKAAQSLVDKMIAAKIIKP